MSREIILTRGLVAVVDDCDYDDLMQFSWCAIWGKGQGVWYAARFSERMHRRILGLRKGDGILVDHVNRNGLDNRRNNLRLSDSTNNARNRRKSVGMSSQFKGVHYCRDKVARPWRALIRVNRAKVHLGYFAAELEAAAAYDGAARRYFGEFAVLNLAP